MGKKQKQPRPEKKPVMTVPARAKQPKSSPPTGGTIQFRFDDIDPEGEWGWRRLTTSCVNTIGTKLPDLETMTWSEATATGTVGVKDIPVSNITRAAQRQLRTIPTHVDVGDLWEVRLGNKQRLWGVRIGDVCQLLWWDPNHTVCPSTRIANTN